MEYRVLEDAAVNENFELMSKILSGDVKLTLLQTTDTVTETEAAAGPSYEIGIRLEDSAGNLHEWYNGKVTLAVAETSDVVGAAMAVDPVAGSYAMDGGTYKAKVTLSESAWAPDDTATLTVTAKVCGFNASATFVVTVEADPESSGG